MSDNASVRMIASAAGPSCNRGIALVGLCAILLFSSVLGAGQRSGPQGQQALPSEAADAEQVADLIKNGVRLDADRITA